MAFSDSVQQVVRQRATGICECTRSNCPHYGRCRVKGTEFHHKRSVAAGGDDEVANCQLLCPACHRQAHGGGVVGRI